MRLVGLRANHVRASWIFTSPRELPSHHPRRRRWPLFLRPCRNDPVSRIYGPNELREDLQQGQFKSSSTLYPRMTTTRRRCPGPLKRRRKRPSKWFDRWASCRNRIRTPPTLPPLPSIRQRLTRRRPQEKYRTVKRNSVLPPPWWNRILLTPHRRQRNEPVWRTDGRSVLRLRRQKRHPQPPHETCPSRIQSHN